MTPSFSKLALFSIALFFLTSTIITADNPYGYYTIPKGTSPTTTDGSGWKTKLTYIPADGSNHPNTSTIYLDLDVNVYALPQNRDCRLRIVPDKSKLQPEQVQPVILPQEVAYFSDPNVSTWVSPQQTNGLPAYQSNSVEWKASTTTQTNKQGYSETAINIVSTAQSVSGSPVANLISVEGLRFEEQWVEMTFSIAGTQNVFGDAYHNDQFCLTCNRPEGFNRSLFNSDEPGVPYDRPLYSTFPNIYLFDDSNDAWYGLHFLNSHAQRMSVGPLDTTTNKRTITMTFLGGVIDVFVMQRSSPLDVVSAWTLLLQPSFDKDAMDKHSPYKSLLHFPSSSSIQQQQQPKFVPEPTIIPPYNILGTSLCRWGYKTIHDVWDAVVQMKNASIPYDNAWSDIDWMRGFRMFDNDPTFYPTDQLNIFIKNLSKIGDMTYTQILDPGIATDLQYGTFSRLIKNQKQFIGQPDDPSMPSIGFVWPGFSALVDYTSPEGLQFWIDEMNRYLDQVPVDYFWQDMNEPASFSNTGSCPGAIGNGTSNWVFPPGMTWVNVDWTMLPIWLEKYCNISEEAKRLNTIPGSLPGDDKGDNFLTNNFSLYRRTWDMASTMHGGSFYALKNTFGFYEGRASHKGFLQRRPGKRPFIMTRSAFSGSGRYVTTWTGDTEATFLGNGGLYDSVQAVLASNIHGIPTNGADTGGFSHPTTPELMARWSQASAYATFWRWHHGNTDPPQEPFRYGESVQRPIREAAIQRFTLVPFLFSLLVQTSRFGRPTITHPSFVFPGEMTKLLENDPRIKIRSNGVTAPRPFFMWGDALLVSPVVEESVDTVPIRFPAASWYDANTLKFTIKGPANIDEYPVTPYNETPIPAFIRAGRILPVHTSVREFLQSDLDNLDRSDPAAVNKFYHDYNYIVNERGVNKTLIKLREQTPIGLLVVHDDINNQNANSPSTDPSTTAIGFGFFDDLNNSLIENDGTFSLLEYTSTINATGGSGTITSVLQSSPPPSLSAAAATTRTFDRRFLPSSSINTTAKRIAGGYIDVVFSTTDVTNQQQLPLPEFCDVNHTGSANALHGHFYCEVSSSPSSSSSSSSIEQPQNNNNRISYKWRITIYTKHDNTGDEFMVPLMDFTQPVTIRWSTQPIAPSSSNTPSPNDNNNNSKPGGDRYGIIITAVAATLSVLLVAAIIGVVYYRNKRKEEQQSRLSYLSLDDVK